MRPNHDSISNDADVIDSRDILARIETLQNEIDAAEVSLDNGAEENTAGPNGEHKPELTTCGVCGKTWDNGLKSRMTPAPSARCPYEYEHDAIEELKALQALEAEAEDYASDWIHGATLIRDSYFQTHAQEVADDIGAIDRDAAWPMSCIDWEQAADELKQDYTSVEFDGVTYWVR